MMRAVTRGRDARDIHALRVQFLRGHKYEKNVFYVKNFNGQSCEYYLQKKSTPLMLIEAIVENSI
jgi:hypothetical protein